MKRLRLLRLGKSLVSGSHFIKYSRVLLGNNGLDYEQGGDHERDGYGRLSHTFWIRPANMKLTNATAETVMA